MSYNIRETSGNFQQVAGNNYNDWVVDADFSNLVITGNFDEDDDTNLVGDGEADSYEFGALSTSSYGQLTSANTATGEFTFTIDKAAVIASGSDQTVTFTITGVDERGDATVADIDTVTINIAICVQRGTLIETVEGRVAVEDLEPGNRVKTLDSGYQPIRWIGSRVMGAADLALEPELRPIRLSAGALGEGTPDRDLLVSPQHRVLVTGWKAELYFGQPEILVPAKALVNDHDIRIAHDVDEVEYFHVLFDKHEIMLTNGALTESFFPGDYVLDELDSRVQAELQAIFPHLAAGSGRFGAAARASIKPSDAIILRQGAAK